MQLSHKDTDNERRLARRTMAKYIHNNATWNWIIYTNPHMWLEIPSSARAVPSVKEAGATSFDFYILGSCGGIDRILLSKSACRIRSRRLFGTFGLQEIGWNKKSYPRYTRKSNTLLRKLCNLMQIFAFRQHKYPDPSRGCPDCSR